ncbi:MAG TPA: hypothetical protein VG227_06555 [Caulobacteraceae bacterium]|jgi:hypothetical protein|nr:hypothetical protein [Caulobacteraceae bacterium]
MSSTTTSETIARVLINCPDTGAPVETVMRMRPSAFEALKGQYGFRCRLCGQIHRWSREDAWLEPLRR